MEKRPLQYTPGFEFIPINNLDQKDEEKARFAGHSFGVILYRGGSVTMLQSTPSSGAGDHNTYTTRST